MGAWQSPPVRLDVCQRYESSGSLSLERLVKPMNAMQVLVQNTSTTKCLRANLALKIPLAEFLESKRTNRTEKVTTVRYLCIA
jgi:hypothetical protein